MERLEQLSCLCAVCGQRQIRQDNICHMNLGAVTRSHESALPVDFAQSGCGGKLFRVSFLIDLGAKTEFPDPSAQHEGNKQSVLHRHLPANTRCGARIVLSANYADDCERIMFFDL